MLGPVPCCAQVIRDLLTPKTYVIVVEHDLAVLDYLSDFICCLYGKPGAYGVVTMPFSVREGINIFLSGFVPTENLRFRDEALTFKVRHLSKPPLQIILICAYGMVTMPLSEWKAINISLTGLLPSM